MKRPIRFASRADAIAQLRAQLERGSWPRAQMMLLVMLTGGSGFLASVVLLWGGMTPMGLRYPVACLVAYACFLALLGFWIRWRRDGSDGLDAGSDLGDVVDAVDLLPGWRGGGGRSGGGGASVEFEAPAGPFASAAHVRAPAASSSDGGGFDLDLDLGDGAVPVLLALLVLGLVLSSLFVVWTAPALFAELLLDGALAAGLYHRLRHIERRHWLETAVRKTIWPFLLTAGVLAAVGFGLQSQAPRADSIGDVLPLLQRSAR